MATQERTITIPNATDKDDAIAQAREQLGGTMTNVVTVVAPFGDLKAGWDVTVQTDTPGAPWEAPHPAGSYQAPKIPWNRWPDE